MRTAARLELKEETATKQLELLDKKMSEASDTANGHLTKFLFGGLAVTIGLLNTDLLILKDFEDPLHRLAGSALISTVALILAHKYFLLVIKQYNVHRSSHRRLKYKYELTLHKLLSQGDDGTYQHYLEKGLKPKASGQSILFPEQATFPLVADYLVDHHSRKLADIVDKPPLFYMAMDIVYLTLAVKLLSLIVNVVWLRWVAL